MNSDGYESVEYTNEEVMDREESGGMKGRGFEGAAFK